MDHGDSRWLVAGYGPANWVENARAAGEVALRRGRHTEQFAVENVGVAEAVPVLRQYTAEVRVARAYFDARADAPDQAVAAELGRHPVLRLRPIG